MTSNIPEPRYDRRAASRVLAVLARPGLAGGAVAPQSPRRIEYTCARLQPEPGSHLTLSQRLYLERFMRPCRAEQVTSATHRIAWTDSEGIPNTGHFHSGGLGPIMPIAMRETVLALWRALRADTGLAQRITGLTDRDRAVLAGTTTDHEPHDIFRVGIEACGRALAQHALLARWTPYRTPAEFALGMRDSGIYSAVATRWYWELQASSYRRGMIAVTLATQPDGTVRYSAETVATLRSMKDSTIADAHRIMRRATTAEGLTVTEAIAKYHDELDLISRQYALLPPGTRPACLAAMPHQLGGAHYSILPLVVDRFTDLFTGIVERLGITEVPAETGSDTGELSADEQIFYVPDMNCQHCVRTITGTLESMSIRVHDIDLISKRVTAEFRSPRNRHRAFEALRDSGYNPTTALPAAASTEKAV
ncbi:heavy-metal-associated domain-containing protein [Nocardia sp. 2]|uniref:Heavy-metal-associated domain-containing protein n=1 Tax=Nocardia acididurans TaxID=2802282 RepID=A0ABS1M8W7_9NOCA|nr:heavy-metal-associated domain-containing protein [Nocardia acididurans]MBL1077090.1 heavy-metal-associated domain-containing protein [Nocardia acididurans]